LPTKILIWQCLSISSIFFLSIKKWHE